MAVKDFRDIMNKLMLQMRFFHCSKTVNESKTAMKERPLENTLLK